MLISFTGPQSSGKSTLLQKMRVCDQYRKCSFVEEVTRKVASKGKLINESGDDITQLFILNEHLQNHMIIEKCTVLDRCIIDGYLYTCHLNNIGRVSSWVVDYSRKLLGLLGAKLTTVFYPDPADVKLVDDGVRSTDTQFRNSIIELYNKFLSDHDLLRSVLPNAEIIKLTGDVDTRMKRINESIYNK
jgi:nicotinamide riboside kinase